MKKTAKRSAIALVLLVAAVFACMFFANRIQTGFGAVEVTEGVIETDIGDLAYKLYTPETATEATPAPGVLLLHGYQNDHETCAAYAIELARRGAVVMAIDEYGHGKTEPGMIERGYVNHRVKVNFGEEDESTFVSVGGATRFRLMMNHRMRNHRTMNRRSTASCLSAARQSAFPLIVLSVERFAVQRLVPEQSSEAERSSEPSPSYRIQRAASDNRSPRS